MGFWLISLMKVKPSLEGLNPCCNGYGFLTDLAGAMGIYPSVLILVVMDMGFWPKQEFTERASEARLNPCCNGYGFLTDDPGHDRGWWLGLNPCCNGYGFLTAKNGGLCHAPKNVLILVVMDMGFWRFRVGKIGRWRCSLNPCCNGYGFLTNKRIYTISTSGDCLNPCCNGYGFLTPQKGEIVNFHYPS